MRGPWPRPAEDNRAPGCGPEAADAPGRAAEPSIAHILPAMWHRIRQAALYFLLGFTVAFVIYLFVRFNADQVLLGMAIGSAVGVIVAAGLLWLEYRFPVNTRS